MRTSTHKHKTWNMTAIDWANGTDIHRVCVAINSDPANPETIIFKMRLSAQDGNIKCTGINDESPLQPPNPFQVMALTDNGQFEVLFGLVNWHSAAEVGGDDDGDDVWATLDPDMADELRRLMGGLDEET